MELETGALELNRSRLSNHLWMRIIGETTAVALVINGFMPCRSDIVPR